jgi:hypothetical protein
MVVRMRSSESNVFRAKSNAFATDLRLPVFDQPMVEPWALKISWEEAMRGFASFREYYIQHFDAPEKRVRDKNPERFSLTYACASRPFSPA